MDYKKQNIQSLFLDLDGTLINSLPRLKYVYDDFLNEYAILGSQREFDELKTSSIEKLIEYFKDKYTLGPPSVKLKKKYESYLEKHYFKAPLFHGVRPFLQAAHEKGLKLYLTSANQKNYIQKILNVHRIETHFKAIYTPQCFSQKVKDASFFQSIMELEKLKPEEVLIIDDSLEIIAGALERGLFAFLFSKINYHPLPSFGSWKSLKKHWFNYAAR